MKPPAWASRRRAPGPTCSAVFRRGTETARDSLQQSLNTATETVRRVTDQFSQVLGFNGPQSEELTRRSSQNLQAVSQASSVLMKGAQDVSQEVFGLVQDRVQKNIEAVNRIAGVRSVQDFVAVQSDLVGQITQAPEAGEIPRAEWHRNPAGERGESHFAKGTEGLTFDE